MKQKYNLIEEHVFFCKQTIHYFSVLQKVLCFISPCCLIISIICRGFREGEDEEGLKLFGLLPILAMFVLFGIYGFIKQFAYGKEWIPTMIYLNYPWLTKKRKVFLNIIIFICFVITAFSIFVCVLSGGNASLENGEYVIIHHGNIVRTISAQEYKYLSLASSYGFAPAFYAIGLVSAVMMHNDYLEEKRKMQIL